MFSNLKLRYGEKYSTTDEGNTMKRVKATQDDFSSYSLVIRASTLSGKIRLPPIHTDELAVAF